MSPGRTLAVCGLELAHNARRSLFWIWAIILVLLALGMSTGKVQIQSGDSTVGGTKAHITSEFSVAMQLAILTLLTYGFFVAVAAGMTVIQDDEHRLGELLHSTGLRPSEYIWGKFVAVLASVLAIIAVQLTAMIVCNHMLPAGAAKEVRGAFHLSNYLRPALLFTVPTVLFMAGLAFAVGACTRRAILVYVLPVAMFLACGFFLWEWSPSWLDPSIDRALMVIDPAAFRWLNETLLKVDRGVKYYNHESIPLDGVFVANRVLMVGVGLGAVVYAQLRLGATMRGTSRRAERAWARQANDAQGATDDEIVVAASRPLAALGMRSRVPGLLAAAWDVARIELVELRSSPGLYLFIPLIVLQAIGPNLVAVGAFDTPLLLTSGTFAARSMGWLTTMTCLLLMFYTVESLLRERNTRLAEISSATPIRSGSVLLGKSLANSFIGVVILLVELAAAAAFFLYQHKVALELRPFALLWGVLLVPTIFLWTTFVMAVLSITRNRYATYAIGLGALIFTGYRLMFGKINWVENWPLWSAVEWSDMSILELDRSALVLSRTMALGLALFFTVLTIRFYFRRDPDATRLMHRLRPAPLFVSALKLLPFALIPLIAGSILWVRVDQGIQGESSKRLEKNYWRKNLATYRDYPLPDVTAVDLEVELDPARGWFRTSGTCDLVNNREHALTEIPVTGGLHWDKPAWTFDGKPYTPEDRSGLYIFRPGEPLQPGKSARLGFRFSGTYPKGISKNGGGMMEFIVPSGVVLTSFGTSFVPVLGYSEQVGVDEENRYESKEYPDDFFKGQTDSGFGSRAPFPTRIKITGPAEFVYNSVGVLESDTVESGRRTSVWKSDHPVNFFNIVAGRWQVRRGQGTAVYYHAGHPYNIAEMVDALDACRKYYSQWFRPYPWTELKLSEFPAYASYAQGFPTDITFSESIGFLTESEPGANVAFLVAAHEAAHQWWGNMIAPGKGPGANLLSEGTSHFSTLLLFEQVKGLHGRIEFAKRIEDRYAKNRRADSERPMVKIDGTRSGDQTVTYDKAGFVFWMLLNQMGRERCLSGIREFFEIYHASVDHPVLQDFLAVMRTHAQDPIAFDEFTRQWFFQVVVPEYQVSELKQVPDGKNWKITATIKNVGSGLMPVEVAATKGGRFRSDGKPEPGYRDARGSVILQGGESKEVVIVTDFKADKLVVDPDAKVLQLRRKEAVKRF